MQDFAMRRDKHFVAPLDLRIDLKRQVWTFPMPRMAFCVMIEDMQIKDITAKNDQEEREYTLGYDRGRATGENDRQKKLGNEYGMNNPPLPLGGQDQDQAWLQDQSDITKNAYQDGYGDGLNNIEERQSVQKPNKIISGIAKILNASDGLEAFINIETLNGMPLKKGSQVMAWRDDSAETYYAINTGITMGKGIVMRDVEPTGDFDRESNTLQGGGMAMMPGGEMVRVYADMVEEISQSIPAGATVSWINVNGINQIVNKNC